MSTIDDARFMRNTAIFLLLLTLIAFAPKYFIPFATGAYEAPSPYMHPHATSALLWTLIFIIQPWFIARGQRTAHRILGYLSLVAAFVVFQAIASPLVFSEFWTNFATGR